MASTLIFAGGGLVCGILTLSLASGEENLLQRFRKRDLSTEEARAAALVETEAQAEKVLRRIRQGRIAIGATFLGVSALELGLGIYNYTRIVTTPACLERG